MVLERHGGGAAFHGVRIAAGMRRGTPLVDAVVLHE
jgi:hypothetical protein